MSARWQFVVVPEGLPGQYLQMRSSERTAEP